MSEEKSVIDQTVAEVEAQGEEKKPTFDDVANFVDLRDIVFALRTEIEEWKDLLEEMDNNNNRHFKALKTKINLLEAAQADYLIQLNMYHEKLNEIASGPGAAGKVVNIHI